jgi:hypothetical protein
MHANSVHAAMFNRGSSVTIVARIMPQSWKNIRRRFEKYIQIWRYVMKIWVFFKSKQLFRCLFALKCPPPPSPLYNVGSDEVDLQNISCNYTNIVEGGGGQCLKIHKVYNFFHHAGLYVSYYMYCICMYLYMYCMYCTVLYYMYCIRGGSRG